MLPAWYRQIDPYIYPVFSWTLSIALLPGMWVMKHVWDGFFNMSEASVWAVSVQLFGWIAAGVISYVVWVFVLSRFFKFIGLWNPFGWKTFRGRPYFLRALVRIADTWESETRFGRMATGAFASLFEVLSNEFHDGDIYFGRPRLPFNAGMLRPIGMPTERHIVTIAGSGAGKKHRGACSESLPASRGGSGHRSQGRNGPA